MSLDILLSPFPYLESIKQLNFLEVVAIDLLQFEKSTCHRQCINVPTFRFCSVFAGCRLVCQLGPGFALFSTNGCMLAIGSDPRSISNSQESSWIDRLSTAVALDKFSQVFGSGLVSFNFSSNIGIMTRLPQP